MASSILIANDYPPITSGIATVFYEIWRRLPPEQTRVLAPKMPKTQQIDASCPTRIKRIRLPLGESGFAKLLKTCFTSINQKTLNETFKYNLFLTCHTHNI